MWPNFFINLVMILLAMAIIGSQAAVVLDETKCPDGTSPTILNGERVCVPKDT